VIDRETPARGYFHVALAGVMLPLASFAISATLAFRAFRRPSLDPAH
jgi:hypothetical protein